LKAHGVAAKGTNSDPELNTLRSTLRGQWFRDVQLSSCFVAGQWPLLCGVESSRFSEFQTRGKIDEAITR
jgi:hypothetical protein